MDVGESVLDTILYEENAEVFEDAEMVDVEDGELIEDNLNVGACERSVTVEDGELIEDNLNVGEGERSVSGVTKVNQESGNGVQNTKKKKKRNKKNKRKTGGCPEGVDVDWFVMKVCRRLRERKSYLVYAAVRCLGVSALDDLVKEVDAIQACGGQKISDRSRFRESGGVLWNILRTRDPNAYKEIMNKGRDFEKQFKHQSIKREPAFPVAGQSSHLESDMVEKPERPKEAENNDEPVKFTGGEKRPSVHDRLRIPVSYSDLLEKDNSDNEKVLEGENLHNGRVLEGAYTLDERLMSSPSAI